MKKCSKCKKVKEFSEFHKKKMGKDGLSRQCKICRKEYNKKYRQENKDKIKEINKKYYQENKDVIKEKEKKYREKNRLHINELRNNYQKNRRKIDPIFRLSINLRSRTSKAFKYKSWHKGGSTEQLLGTTFKEAKKHIEKQFNDGMTWDNYGEWHIDHIIPLASATTKEELKKLCHYTNLQPLWAEENMSKGARVE